MFQSTKRFLVGFASVAAMALLHGQALPSQSPFLPSTSATGEDLNAAYGLLGMTVVGKQTLLSISRLSDKRSFWVPLGETVAEVTAVSYDSKSDEAVIRADGRMLTLTLGKGVVLPRSAMPVEAARSPAPVTPTPAAEAVQVPSGPMTVQQEKEMEARMLVTDLLEIGQEQRKAYELAQRQAAARANGLKVPTVPAQKR